MSKFKRKVNSDRAAWDTRLQRVRDAALEAADKEGLRILGLQITYENDDTSKMTNQVLVNEDAGIDPVLILCHMVAICRDHMDNYEKE